MSEQNIKPIDMDEVWFELQGLVAIVELIDVAMNDDCEKLKGVETIPTIPKESWRHITLADRTKTLYAPALDHICGQLHALFARVGVSK